MIYYFSGTGNSEWVAKKIASLTNDSALDIAELVRNGKAYITVKSGDVLGLIFPVYAWSPPYFVLDFLKSIKVEEGAFCFAVCTCGDEAGLTIKIVEKMIPLNSGYSVSMPNNYILLADVDSADIEKQKLDAAKIRVQKIADDVLSKKSVFDFKRGSLAFLKSNLINFSFNKYAMSSKPFFVEATCNSCGICAAKCPTQNIKIVDGKPVWGQNCLQCLSCLNRCPQKAIQYGKKTKNKGRYYFKGEKI